jgi:hypothetical protein
MSLEFFLYTAIRHTITDKNKVVNTLSKTISVGDIYYFSLFTTAFQFLILQTQPNTTKHDQTQPSTTKHNQARPNTTKHNQTQPNTTKHNQTQPNTTHLIYCF